MSFLNFWRNTKKEIPEKKMNTAFPQKDQKTTWKAIPLYIEADFRDFQLVSIITSAIAANDYPKSEFVVKKIVQANPRVKEIALIMASIATEDETQKYYVIKNIKEKED
ncbi:hypothetical protein [Enterococcus casseliflavus]|uniref:hypothetical protein n=1 Tax=Enterococcus casseliflavus TaxID=37734 RepID=UPI0018844FC3|nr:hypothetical protein [Enterococcus casseliflavus]MBE9909423.1 hypothetical protein [Enterococcus casseliflavus]